MRRKKYNPFLLHVMMLSWDGFTPAEIAAKSGRALPEITKLLGSDEAADIYARLEAQTIDTHQQTQAALQALQPRLLQEKIKLALNATKENVKNKALQDLLDMGGHGAIRRVDIRRPDAVEEDYQGKSDEDIRRELLADLTVRESDEPTVH